MCFVFVCVCCCCCCCCCFVCVCLVENASMFLSKCVIKRVSQTSLLSEMQWESLEIAVTAEVCRSQRVDETSSQSIDLSRHQEQKKGSCSAWQIFGILQRRERSGPYFSFFTTCRKPVHSSIISTSSHRCNNSRDFSATL